MICRNILKSVKMEIEGVLLTGATGFIGKELLPKLLEKGYEVHTIERYATGRYTLTKKIV